MKIKLQLSILNFLEFFIWGSWLLSAGAYMANTLQFSAIQIGSVYATMGITSLVMPTVMGVVADRWVKIEKLFSHSHIIIFLLLLVTSYVRDFTTFYILMFVMNALYMPTIALNYSLSYSKLTENNLDTIKDFPPIRVWGTIGFIAAAWIVDLMSWSISSYQFLVSASAALTLAVYVEMFIKTSQSLKEKSSKNFFKTLVEDAVHILRKRELLVFFIFSILLGSLLQITNIWGVPFLNSFSSEFPGSFVVKHSVILISLSQISETLFILAIPFFYRKYGIKVVVLISIIAWVLRFGFFAVGHPEGIGFAFIIMSMIVYGLAFDFFNVSGSLYIDKETDSQRRSSAQGLFAMATGGIGPILGGYGSGLIVDFFTSGTTGNINWVSVWLVFSILALLIAILFTVFFKTKSKKL